jgi:FtsH-binding integral membrane protein
MPLAPLLIAVALLFVGAAGMPYGYYTLLRVVVCFVFAWASVESFKRNVAALPWLFGTLAILFNPVWKVYFPKLVWSALDIGAAMFLLLTAKLVSGQRKPE